MDDEDRLLRGMPDAIFGCDVVFRVLIIFVAPVNPFTTGNPFLGTKLLGFSVGRGSGALKGLRYPCHGGTQACPGPRFSGDWIFYRNSKKHGCVNTLRLELRPVRGRGLGYTRVKSVSSTDAVSLFRLVSL